MHTEIRTPSEAQIQQAQQFLTCYSQITAQINDLKKLRKQMKQAALSLLEIPVIKLP